MTTAQNTLAGTMRPAFLAACLAVGAAQAAGGQATSSFTGVNVVTMTDDGVLADRTVIVRDGVVVAIGPDGEVPLPPGGGVIDGGGRYLMPGLADMHVHLRDRGEYINYLAHGVTTVMSLGAPEGLADRIRDDRDAIRGGDALGPNIIATARILDGVPATTGSSALRSLETPGAARAAVAELDRAGFDFVKLYNNLAREAFDAVVEEAGARGLPVVGHIPRNFDPAHGLIGGLDVVAHAEEFFFTVFGGPRSTSDLDRSYRPDRSLIPGLIELLAGSGVFVIPNLSFSYGIQVMWDGMENVWEDPEMAYLAPATRDQWRSGNIDRRDDLANFVFRERLKYDLMQELTLRFQEAGVLLLLGTDAAAPTLFPGRSAHRELRELVKAGLTHADALRVGTRNAGDFAARHLRDEERFGRVAVGYRADLVLVDGDPLEDVRNAARISGVMVRGRWWDRDEIDARRAALANQYATLTRIGETLARAAGAGTLADTAARLAATHSASEEALLAIEQAINALGYARVGAGELEAARELFEINTTLFPSSANTWDSLAETYLALGDRQKAIELYRKALEVDPSFANARAQLDRILTND